MAAVYVEATSSFTYDLARFVVSMEDSKAPDAPGLITPSDGYTTSKNIFDFGWTSRSDPSGLNYRLQIATDSGFNSLYIDDNALKDNSYTPATDFPEDNYWWRVMASDGVGNDSSWSSTRSFTVNPGGPELISPEAPEGTSRVQRECPHSRA